VSLQRAEEQQAQQGGVRAASDAVTGEGGEDEPVVLFLRRVLHRRQQFRERNLLG
jgi:hypothetical protein